MEYPFKLSEIIAGLESGAWLNGAMFENKKGETLFVSDDLLFVKGTLTNNENWGFVKYVD